MSDSDAWVVDRGLLVLRDQINAAWPNRDKGSDGTIGDAAHAARDSDHNPETPAPAGNPDRQVDALDVTHDPAHGADMAVVSEAIRASHDVRVKYVIFASRIVYPTARNGHAAWEWQTYSGSDPHTNHMHVSVNDVHHDETQPWQIGVGGMDQSTLLREKTRFSSKIRDLGHFLGDVLRLRDWLWLNPLKDYGGAKPTDPDMNPDPDSRLAKLLRQVDEIATRPPVVAGPVDEELIRRIVREELDKTKLGAS